MYQPRDLSEGKSNNWFGKWDWAVVLQAGLNCDPENIFLVSCGLGEITSFIELISYVLWYFGRKFMSRAVWDTNILEDETEVLRRFLPDIYFPVQMICNHLLMLAPPKCGHTCS